MTAALVATTLVSCGGGGGSSGTSPFDGGSGATACPSSGAQSGATGGSTCVTAASLNLLLSTSSVDDTGVSTVTATATATATSGQVVSGVGVTFSVDNGATFTQSSAVTGANGQATAIVSIGSDPSNRVITVTATSGSLTARAPFAVTGASLSGTRVPATVLPSSAGNRVDFRLVDVNGKALANRPISITAGSLGTTTGVTGVNGDYSYTYTAPSAIGSLDIVATAGGVSNTQTVSIQSSSGTVPVATPAIQSASVSANPSVVSTNTSSTNNRTEVRALFVGANNTPVKNVRVRFDLAGDVNSVGGTFSTGSNVVYSDDNGIATTAYIPGTRSSPTNGVTVRACYDAADFVAGTCVKFTSTTITVASDPLSVTIGSNSDIIVGANNLTYKRQFVILVVDASGRAKANVDIIPSIDIDRYYKGYYTNGSGKWVQTANTGGCANEDTNRNGVLEAVEDINHSGAIEPRKSDVAVTILGTGKTDASGLATVQIEYPQNVASWAEVKILVSATGVSGTEGRATWTEVLPVLASALSNASVAPPFIFSPYGVVTTAVNPTIASPTYPGLFPKTNFPDGTVIPNAVITDPCKNPF
ncbi:MAG: hypothetical protein M3Z16_08105 [Pseudomonadota bacterium]|nr:hypothetical protein [Pseudomonadota bacterium]